MTCDNCEYKHTCNKHRMYDEYNDKVTFVEYTDKTCDSFKSNDAQEVITIKDIKRDVLIMRWKTLEQELPDYEREIFAKIQEQAYNNNNPENTECYVLMREENWCGHEGDSYVEALGERYMSFEPSEIIGWVYVDDLQEMLDRGE